eukprot:m.56385 g.56385  ORF g.56385 m.56385 type:complete len:898 (-) comp13011_c0_seq1:187-2880(-)
MIDYPFLTSYPPTVCGDTAKYHRFKNFRLSFILHRFDFERNTAYPTPQQGISIGCSHITVSFPRRSAAQTRDRQQMAVKKSDAYEALQQLIRLRNTIDDEQLIEDIDRLTSVMKSKLFVALLEVQEFFEQRFVSESSNASNISQQGAAIHAGDVSRPPLRAELEWEDAFDFGAERPMPQEKEGNSSQLVEELEEVNLVYGSSGIGISIAGGVDRPFLEKDTSIFVTGLVPGGAAEKNGRILMGDKIVSINGVSCEDRQHHQVVQLLRSSDALQIVVAHNALQRRQRLASDKAATGFLVVDLQRVNGGLGFTIAGGKDTPHVAGNDGIFITKIIPGGAAHEDGRLAVGDKIISIGGKQIDGWRHDDVVQEMQLAEDIVLLGIEKNAYNKAVAELSKSLGFTESPVAKFSKNGTLMSFGNTSSDENSLPLAGSLLASQYPKRSVRIHPSAKGSLGMAIVGPSSARASSANEPSGIFISSITEGGPAQQTGDLFEGDQILSVNGIDLTTASYVQATEIIRSNCKGDLDLIVRQNPEVFAMYRSKMAKLQKRLEETKKRHSSESVTDEHTYVRALFDYDPGSDTGLTTKEKKKTLLPVRLSDVFMMIEWKANKDWWEVENVSSHERGWVPSPHRWHRLHGHVNVSSTTYEGGDNSDAAKGGLKKRSRSFRFARRLSLSRRKKSSTAITVSCYEIVMKRHQTADMIRPVILLGPSKDELTDMLFAEFPELFGSCVPHTTRPPRDGEVHGEDYFFTTQDAMAAGIEAGDFIEAGQYNNHLYGTSFDSLRDVIKEGRVCILDVSAHAIEHLKRKDIHPIVIFVKPDSLSLVKTQNPHLDDETASTVFQLAEEVYKDFRPHFTQVVINQDLTQAYHRVVQTIRQQSKEPYWAPIKDQNPLSTFTS